MLDAAAMNRILAETVPFNAHMGPVVESVTPERSVVMLPESPERLNHVGTTHAVAQFGLGEVTSGALTMAFEGDERKAELAKARNYLGDPEADIVPLQRELAGVVSEASGYPLK